MNPRRLIACVLVLSLVPALRAQETKPSYPPPSEVKAAFLKLLDRPKVPLNVKAGEPKTEGDLVVETLSFAAEKKADGEEERVPVLIVRPAKADKKLPAVICLHGTGSNKESQKGFMVDLAKRGMIGVAIDARYHGARSGGKGKAAYVDAITRAWRTNAGEKHEHPFFYDTCWDLWRTVDYLLTRADVDPQRIGMMGVSMGGIETWLAAAVDDRVQVSVPVIGVQSFKWSLEHDKWQGRANTIKDAHEAAAKDLGEDKVNQKVCKALWSKIIPGSLDQFDCPSMIRLFAGRPLLILSCEKDGNCPLEGAKLAFATAEEAYKEAKASDQLKIMVAAGAGHTFTKEHRQAALDWLEKWLK